MQAPQIPRLSSRRGNAPGPSRGLRAIARARNAAPTDPSTEDSHRESSSSSSKDRLVQQTDGDASGSRLSAVELGYLHDEFASILASDSGPGLRRFPIINRGTYVRTTAIDTLVERFLDSNHTSSSNKRQVISLGAGSDTRPWRLLSTHTNPNLDIIYHELDFPANTAPKISAILSHPHLLRTLRIDNPDADLRLSPQRDALHSPSFHIHPVDLRTLSKDTSPSFLEGIDRTAPTILISECCLIYLRPDVADNVIAYFTESVFPAPPPPSPPSNQDTPPLALIIYEPINPHDPFGREMVLNLAARGLRLETLHKYHSLAAQRARMRDYGFAAGQEAVDVDHLWEKWVSRGEHERIARLEMLDELEEWRLLARHYCVAWGWRDGTSDDTAVFEGWKSLPSSH